MISRKHPLARLIRWRDTTPWWKCALVIYAIAECYTLVVSQFIDADISDIFASNADMFFSTLFIAPTFETLFSQLALVEAVLLITKLTVKKELPLLAILVSSFVFSILHDYNVGYQLSAFFAGFLFATTYWLFSHNRNWLIGFAMTALVHFLCNLTSGIFNLIFNG